jgi:hypothetical protein
MVFAIFLEMPSLKGKQILCFLCTLGVSDMLYNIDQIKIIIHSYYLKRYSHVLGP